MNDYKLTDIARCNLKDKENSPLWIPPIQRGLVWKSTQIELLWDSILSGYPIGSLIVLVKESEVDDSKPQGEIKEISNGQLLDGQQRVNSIIMGFDNESLLYPEIVANHAPLKSILWIDLKFNVTESRNYGLMLNTQAHPWGYELDGGKLSAEDRRVAIGNAGYSVDSYTIDKKELDLRRFWPYKAKCPVPLSFIIRSFFDNKDISFEGFRNELIKMCDAFGRISPKWYECFIAILKSDETLQFTKELYDILKKRAKDYSIHSNVITAENKEKIELLFNRINTGGTPFSQEELAYSAIKLYWPEIAEPNREIASKCMPEARFAHLVFRMFDIADDKGNYRMSGEIDAAKIRRLAPKIPDVQNSTDLSAKDINEEKYINEVTSAYTDGTISRIQQQVDKWIIGAGEDALPSVLRTDIANSHQTLYILLLRLAKYSLENRICLSDDYVRALALFLHSYSADKKGDEGIRNLYKDIIELVETNKELTEETVTNALAEYLGGFFLQPISDMNNFIGFQGEMTPEWRIDSYSNEKYFESVRPFFFFESTAARTMLWVAMRKFYNKFFKSYDPARRDLWENDNRPWDRDHIVPNDWQSGKSGKCKEFIKTWIWSAGNRADIPFEINRGKGASSDWSFYLKDDNAGLLFFDEGINTLTPEYILKSSEGAIKFATLTRQRFIKLYNEFYKFVEPLGLESVLSKQQTKRREILLGLKERLDSDALTKGRFTIKVVKGEKEQTFKVDDLYYWRRPWLSISAERDGRSMDALTIDITNNQSALERGIRKHCSLDLKTSDHTWWPGKCERVWTGALTDNEDKVNEFINDWISSLNQSKED